MTKTRVVLADDHRPVRAGLRKLLERAPGIEVVGEASNGVEALELVSKEAPDILLLDVDMPEKNGIQVARELRAAGSEVLVLAISAYDQKYYIQELLANGAAGYITKDEAPELIVAAIRGVARGERGWFSTRAKARIEGS